MSFSMIDLELDEKFGVFVGLCLPFFQGFEGLLSPTVSMKANNVKTKKKSRDDQKIETWYLLMGCCDCYGPEGRETLIRRIELRMIKTTVMPRHQTSCANTGCHKWCVRFIIVVERRRKAIIILNAFDCSINADGKQMTQIRSLQFISQMPS